MKSDVPLSSPPRSDGALNLSTLLKFNDISPEVQSHLARVFGLVACGVFVAALGCGAGIVLGLSGVFALFVGSFGACALLLCAHSTDRSAASFPKRAALFAAFAAAEGLAISPLTRLLSEKSPALVFQALFLAVAVFGAFALAAIVSRRRAYLALYGTLGSCASGLLVMSLINVFFVRSPSIRDAELGLGLLLAVGFTAVNTQLIIERASIGAVEPDAFADAAQLFLDLVQIFIRIAIILLRRREGGGGGGGGGRSSSASAIVSAVSGARDEL